MSNPNIYGLPVIRPFGSPLMDLGCNIQKIELYILQEKQLFIYKQLFHMFLVVLYTFIALHINKSMQTNIIEYQKLYFLKRVNTISYQSASKLRSTTLVKLRIKSLTISTFFTIDS